MKNIILNVGEKHAFKGHKLIVFNPKDWSSESFPISKKVAEALKKYGYPSQG